MTHDVVELVRGLMEDNTLVDISLRYEAARFVEVALTKALSLSQLEPAPIRDRVRTLAEVYKRANTEAFTRAALKVDMPLSYSDMCHIVMVLQIISRLAIARDTALGIGLIFQYEISKKHPKAALAIEMSWNEAYDE